MPSFGDVPNVQVNITANDQTSAAFAQAQRQVQAFDSQIRSAGSATEYSMREARGAVMLLGDEIGVKLNRHVAGFLAAIPAVGSAMAMAFSAVAVIELGKEIYKAFTNAKDMEKEAAAEKSYETHLGELNKKLVEYDRQTQLIGKSDEQRAQLKMKWAQQDTGMWNDYLKNVRAAYDATKALSQQTELVFRPEDIMGVGGEAAYTSAALQAQRDLPQKYRDLQIAEMESNAAALEATIVHGKEGEVLEKLGQKAEEAAKKYADLMFKVYQQSQKISPTMAKNDDYLPGDFREGVPMRSMNFPLITGGEDDNVKEAAKIYKETRTNAETYKETIDGLNELLKAGALDQETYNRALAQAKGKYDDNTIAMKRYGAEIGDALKQGILMGRSWDDIMKTILIDTIELIAQMTILKKLNQDNEDSGGSSGSGGLFGSILGGLFGGHRAGGGPVNASMPYLVGESGPEIFMPHTSGKIIPNSGIGGVTFLTNVDARGADASVEYRVMRAIKASEERSVSRAVQAVRELNARR